MSTRIAKEELALLMPSTLSHYFQDDARDLVSHGPQGADQGRTLFDRAAGAIRWMLDLPRRRAVLNELEGLSERELADIGLSREELPRVFESNYATQRSSRIASLS